MTHEGWVGHVKEIVTFSVPFLWDSRHTHNHTNDILSRAIIFRFVEARNSKLSLCRMRVAPLARYRVLVAERRLSLRHDRYPTYGVVNLVRHIIISLEHRWIQHTILSADVDYNLEVMLVEGEPLGERFPKGFCKYKIPILKNKLDRIDNTYAPIFQKRRGKPVQWCIDMCLCLQVIWLLK